MTKANKITQLINDFLDKVKKYPERDKELELLLNNIKHKYGNIQLSD